MSFRRSAVTPMKGLNFTSRGRNGGMTRTSIGGSSDSVIWFPLLTQGRSYFRVNFVQGGWVPLRLRRSIFMEQLKLAQKPRVPSRWMDCSSSTIFKKTELTGRSPTTFLILLLLSNCSWSSNDLKRVLLEGLLGSSFMLWTQIRRRNLTKKIKKNEKFWGLKLPWRRQVVN